MTEVGQNGSSGWRYAKGGFGAIALKFSLERHVLDTHLLRHIDRFVELDGLRRELLPFYSEMADLHRFGAADSDADRQLLLRYPLGAAAVRGGAPQPGISLL